MRIGHTLSDFVAVVCTTFEEVVDGPGCLQGFVFRLAADAEDGHVFHRFGELHHCLALEHDNSGF